MRKFIRWQATKVFCWGVSQGLAATDRCTQGCCWPHHLRNSHPRGQNQQCGQRGISPHRNADISGTRFHFRTAFQLVFSAPLSLLAVLSGCHGCRVFWQDPSSHCHHGLHLLQPGNDLRWILHAKPFFKIYMSDWWTRTKRTQTCMTALVSCAHLFVLLYRP